MFGKGGGLTPAANAYAGGGSAGGQDSSAGQPIYLTDPNAVATKAGEQVKQGAEKLGSKIEETGGKLDSTLNQDTGQMTQESTGIFQYLGNLVYDLFPRIVGGMGAVLLIGLGIWLIGRGQPTPAPRR
jgi:hypothetical protein